MTMVSLSSIPLGDEVSIAIHSRSPQMVDGYVIARSKDRTCVGFTTCDEEGWHPWSIITAMNGNLISAIQGRDGYSSIAGLCGCLYAWWFYSTDEVIHFQRAMVSPTQSCIDCKLPAPHAQPNAGFGFVCVSCVVLRDIV